MLVFAASVLVQTMARLRRQDPGFPTEHLLIAQMFMPPARYPNADAITRFCDAFAERVRPLPGVVHASMTNRISAFFPMEAGVHNSRVSFLANLGCSDSAIRRLGPPSPARRLSTERARQRRFSRRSAS
jgi:hypothetical protein